MKVHILKRNPSYFTSSLDPHCAHFKRRTTQLSIGDHLAACYVRSLTHSGRNVFQACLQSAAPFFLIVSNVGLQEGHAKLSLIHHSYQAASCLTWNLAFYHQPQQTDRKMVLLHVLNNVIIFLQIYLRQNWKVLVWKLYKILF